MEQIRFDDVDALRAKVTEEFGDWGPELEVTQELIDEFAELTGDRQWIHVDVERARTGPFGATIAHGLLTLALAARVRGPGLFEVVGHESTLNYGCDGLRYLDPVYAGSKIHSRSRLVDVQAHPRGTRVTTEIAVHVVGNDRPSMSLKAVVLHTGGDSGAGQSVGGNASAAVEGGAWSRPMSTGGDSGAGQNVGGNASAAVEGGAWSRPMSTGGDSGAGGNASAAVEGGAWSRPMSTGGDSGAGQSVGGSAEPRRSKAERGADP